ECGVLVDLLVVARQVGLIYCLKSAANLLHLLRFVVMREVPVAFAKVILRAQNAARERGPAVVQAAVRQATMDRIPPLVHPFGPGPFYSLADQFQKRTDSFGTTHLAEETVLDFRQGKQCTPTRHEFPGEWSHHRCVFLRRRGFLICGAATGWPFNFAMR